MYIFWHVENRANFHIAWPSQTNIEQLIEALQSIGS